jgi:hypothetical protein
MALTPEQQAKVHKYLGYPVLDRADLIRDGIGGGDEVQFALSYNLTQLKPAGEKMVLEQVAKLECIEALQMKAYQGQLVEVAGSVRMAGMNAIAALQMAYTAETDKLADLLHVPKFKHSNTHWGSSGMGAVIEPC